MRPGRELGKRKTREKRVAEQSCSSWGVDIESFLGARGDCPNARRDDPSCAPTLGALGAGGTWGGGLYVTGGDADLRLARAVEPRPQ